MTEINLPTVTVIATEVVLPGKVEPSGLRLVQRALPPPAAGQALVRVESTAVSFAESAMRRGRYYGQPPFPFVPGYDLVGVVEAVGPGVNRSLTGRRVAALTKTGGWATAAPTGTRPECTLPGREPPCPTQPTPRSQNPGKTCGTATSRSPTRSSPRTSSPTPHR